MGSKERLKRLIAKNKILHPIIKSRNILPVINNADQISNPNAMTLIMVVRQGYDWRKPNANYKIRAGFCGGFRKLGWNIEIVSVWDLARKVRAKQNLLLFLSIYDYLDLSRAERKMLRDIKHIVWVHPDNEKMIKVYKSLNYTYEPKPEKLYQYVQESMPNFIFTVSPESGFDFFSNWNNTGLKLKSVPLACDDDVYFVDESNHQLFENTEMAFVGGYWPKKALQFDQYLRPFEDRLKVFGYSKWPYKGYSGLLKEDHERLLYRSSRVSPSISEPHAQFTGDIVERVFKIMGSGGLAVTDINEHYKSIFKKDEVLIPKTINEYKDLINTCLNDKDFNWRYRMRGLKAISNYHTYTHRAKLIIKYLLDLDAE